MRCYFRIVAVILKILSVVSSPCRQGEPCKHNCSSKCEPLLKNQVPCNETTGECYDGCIRGFYGLSCNLTCSQNCLNIICAIHSGHCTYPGCNNNYSGDNCEIYNNCSASELDEKSRTATANICEGTSGPLIGLAVGFGTLLLIVLLYLGAKLRLHFKKKQSRRQQLNQGYNSRRNKHVDSNLIKVTIHEETSMSTAT